MTIALSGDAEEAAQSLQEALASSGEVTGRVAGRAVRVIRHPTRAIQKGAFAPVFYGLLHGEGTGCCLEGHIQLHPVGRLFVGVWIGMSTLLALALLAAGALRATPESTALDALPFLLPALLPLFGLALARWQRGRGKSDEEAIRGWLDSLEEGRSEQS